MEFKGSKGPWFNDDGVIEDKKGREICDVYSNWPTKKYLYNRQLISKAPEMLEMINLLIDRLEENNLGDLKAVERAKQLIKQATEI